MEKGTGQSPLSSATRADVDQTIKPHLILLDPLRQSVFVGVGLVNANELLPAYLCWLSMADESLRITMSLRLCGV
jgi:hypothetical protein